MMDYKKVCANCLRQANIVVGLWEGLYERSLNYGDDITIPYDVMPLDDIDGGSKSINEICKEIETDDMLECRYMYITTDRLIRAFCEIIGEPYNDDYLSHSKQHFWKLAPISGKYAFTLLEMWCVVNEYDYFMKLHGSRDLIEKAVKEWHDYHQCGGKINLLHWMIGARYEATNSLLIKKTNTQQL